LGLLEAHFQTLGSPISGFRGPLGPLGVLGHLTGPVRPSWSPILIYPIYKMKERKKGRKEESLQVDPRRGHTGPKGPKFVTNINLK
jgi:hypothetical protein